MGITDVIRGDDHLSNTPKQLLVLEALGADAAALRPPAAPARARRQEALEAPRRRLGAGAARRRLPAGGAAQLPRAARLGRRRRPDDPLDPGADRAVLDRAGRALVGDLRRAQAALAQRPLHARAAARPTTSRRPRRSSSAPATRRPPPTASGSPPPARSRRRRRRRSTELWPLIAFLFEPPVDDPKAWSKVMERDGVAAALAARARGPARRGALRRGRRSRRVLGAVVERLRSQAARRLPAAAGGDHRHARSRPGSSNRSPSSGRERSIGAGRGGVSTPARAAPASASRRAKQARSAADLRGERCAPRARKRLDERADPRSQATKAASRAKSGERRARRRRTPPCRRVRRGHRDAGALGGAPAPGRPLRAPGALAGRRRRGDRGRHGAGDRGHARRQQRRGPLGPHRRASARRSSTWTPTASARSPTGLETYDVLEQPGPASLAPRALPPPRGRGADRRRADRRDGAAAAARRARRRRAAARRRQAGARRALRRRAARSSARGEPPEERARRERRELGIDHALVGAVLVRRWGLPPIVASAVERHHAADATGHAAAIRLADLVVHHAAGDPVSAEAMRDDRRPRSRSTRTG